MTRILFACTGVGGHGGIQRFNRNLLRAWSEIGARVDVLSLMDAPDDMHHPAGISVRGASGSKPRWLGMLAGDLAGGRHDLYVAGHLHLAPALLPVLTARTRRRTRLLLHGIEVWGRVQGIRRAAASRFGLVLSVSRYTRDSFLQQAPGYPEEQALLFPNTINRELAERPVRERSTTPGVLRLLSVSRLARTERDKGIVHVLESLAKLPEGLDVEYVVIGDGDDRQDLARYAEELGVPARVKFRGRVADDELWAAYESADVFVLPSRKEGFGIVFLEAMHFGLPVIGAAEKGALDVIRNGEAGYLVPFAAPDRLADVISSLAGDAELRRRLGATGRRLVGPDGEFGFPAFRSRCAQWSGGA